MATAFPHISFRMRWMSAASFGSLLVLAIVVAMSTGSTPTLAPAAGPSSAAAADPKVGSSLSSLAAEQPGQPVQAIVRMAAGVSPAVGRELWSATPTARSSRATCRSSTASAPS